jgi:hypothetical protein
MFGKDGLSNYGMDATRSRKSGDGPNASTLMHQLIDKALPPVCARAPLFRVGQFDQLAEIERYRQGCFQPPPRAL